MKTLAEKLKEMIDATPGLNTVILADKIGVTQPYISQLLAGSKGGGKETITKLAKFFKTPIEYWINDNIEDIKDLQVDINNDKDDTPKTIYVPFFKDGAVSAGFGSGNDDMGDYELLPFNPQDLRIMFNVSPNAKIGIIPCFGNSMEPTIKESDLVVFSSNQIDIIEGAIYVCRYDNELFVKRIKKRPTLQLISDNKDYEPITIEENLFIEIIGRVVGSYSINSKRI
ncbi:helix-turn-helix transcriptional regulator [Campylobacter sp. faydin G-24]|uniref:Helix-turn-helix transcriptional regulator n=1 Tax=Campylobacter anatolicus TaxID=2829105 RepID=A0ABS5HJU3_9BACT|nr:XRE family transcriptional regulator [Campylobacter anatolicus]MBR8461501.1 helix-turn-helix transcriptional regulator [Campylobacter anatolicus]MBR8464417.1 helix-turn-helix transcriptional regulator [Campylobacter anatolicus]